MPRSFSFRDSFLTPVSVPEAGVDPRRNNGATQVSGFIDTFSKYGVQPRDPNFAAAVASGTRQFNYLDFRSQYAGSVLPLDLRTAVQLQSAAQLNALNSFLYTQLCPLKLTEELNFDWEHMDFYMAPFDEMVPLNIARTTGFRRISHKQTISFYKRSIEIEGTLLNDAKHGPIALGRNLAALEGHVELTFMYLIAIALVELPTMYMLERRTNDQYGFDHARQSAFDDVNVFMGARDPGVLMNVMAKMVKDSNRIDSAVGPVGFCNKLSKNAVEKTYAEYRPFLDTQSSRVLMGAYELPDRKRLVLPVGGGAGIQLFDMHKFSGYRDDFGDEQTQPLQARLTLGEVILSPPPNMADVESPDATTTGKMLDVVTVVEGSRVDYKRYVYRVQLESNVMFLDDDGQLKAGPEDGTGYYLKKVVKLYKDRSVEKSFLDAFRNPEHRSNDMAAVAYLGNDVQLAESKGFRHYCSFVCYNDAKAKLAVPKWVGDVEPKTLPPSYLMQMALVLARETKVPLPDDDFEDAVKLRKFLSALKKILPTSALFNGGTDIFSAAWAASMIPICRRLTRAFSADDFFGKGALPIEHDRPFTNADLFTLRARSPLLPLAGETKAQYAERLTPAVLAAAVADGHLNASSSGWARLLQHVPDDGLASFLSLVHTVHADGRAATAADAEALAKLTEHVATYSGKAHVPDQLRAALAAVDAGPAAALADNLRTRLATPLITSKMEQRANDRPVPAAHVAAALRASFERTPLGSVVGTDFPSPDHADETAANQYFFEKLTDREKRYSWACYEKQLRESANVHDRCVRLTYVALLNSRFNFFTAATLARYGQQLFTQGYFRFFVDKAADALVMLHAGYDNWFLAAGHGQVVTGVGSAENSWTLHAQMHLGVVPQPLAREMQILPYVFPSEHLGGRSGMPIVNMTDAMHVDNARDRPSDIVLPIPVNETRFEFPMSPFRTPIYASPNSRTVQHACKSSVTDLLSAFMGDDTIEMAKADNNVFAQFYNYPLVMAFHVHRACVWRPVSNLASSHEYGVYPGTGPLNRDPAMCTPQASDAFAGMGPFPTSYPATLVY